MTRPESANDTEEKVRPRAGRAGTPSVTIRSHAKDEPIGEESLSRFFADLVQSGGSATHLLRRPRGAFRALLAISSLPLVTTRTGSGPDGLAIRSMLARPLRLRVLRGVNAALAIPATREEYLAGRPKHGLRQNIRAGEKRGMTSRLVTDPGERLELLRVLNAYERINPVLEFRNTAPENDDLLDLTLWVLTESDDGRPLLLGVAAVDGPVAALRYYRTLSDDDDTSVARYFTMPFLVDRLRELGATHLAETALPHLLPNGLRQFQRKVGFRLIRLRLAD
jgi:hypothetical protein